jgi:hypothetical protein
VAQKFHGLNAVRRDVKVNRPVGDAERFLR